MKTNYYELFSAYTPETDKRREKSVPKLKKDVLTRIGAKKRRMTGRIAIGAVMASVCVVITVGAVSGSIERFFTAVSQAKIRENENGGSLPAVGENNADMTAYYSLPEGAELTSEGDISAELLGMYSDSHTVMLSLSVRTPEPLDTSDACMPFYFTAVYPDGSEKLLTQSGLVSSYELVQADFAEGENTYYMTFYLTDQELAGSTLKLESDGIFSSEQLYSVFKQLQDEQMKMVEELGIEEASKPYEGYEGFILGTKQERSLLAEKEPIAAGTVSGEIPVPLPASEPFETEAYGVTMSFDSLSLYVSQPTEEMKGEVYAGHELAVYLKDGTVISNFRDIDYDIRFAYHRGAFDSDSLCGSIYCFNRPIDISEVEKVVMYVVRYEDFNTDNVREVIDEYVIYGE